jgi:hypothetical protein
VGKKCTKEDKARRLMSLHNLFQRGYSRIQMCHYAAKKWGISSRQTDRLRQELFEEVEKEYRVERKEAIVVILDQLTHVYAQSIKTGQLSNALGALNAKVKLLRLDPSNCR